MQHRLITNRCSRSGYTSIVRSQGRLYSNCLQVILVTSYSTQLRSIFLCSFVCLNLFCAKHLESLLQISKRLLHSTPRRTVWCAKHQLGLADPAPGQVPDFIERWADVLLVVLKVRAKAFSAKSRPCCDFALISSRAQVCE